jgi:2-polyprenyl-3-methyl-5-hydroxy-6-metoxy-1,4-benzoquinol methylase
VLERKAQRFQKTDKYVAFLRTIEGRLRGDLGWTNLQGFLPATASGCRAFDIGGGTGTLRARMAALGFEVARLDISEPMLALARKEAADKKLRGGHFVSAGRRCSFVGSRRASILSHHNLSQSAGV